MTADELLAALLAQLTEREKLLEKGIYGLSERECIVMERKHEAAAVEAMLETLSWTIAAEDADNARAVYLAARYRR